MKYPNCKIGYVFKIVRYTAPRKQKTGKRGRPKGSVDKNGNSYYEPIIELRPVVVGIGQDHIGQDCFWLSGSGQWKRIKIKL